MINYLRCLVIIAFVFSVAGCIKSGSTPVYPASTAFYVIQASPNAPNTDIYINGGIALPNTAYGVDTGYVYPAPGAYEFKVAETGKTTYYLTKSFNLDSNIFYSIFFIDSVSKMKAVAVEDNFSIPATDSVQVRYLDFCPDLVYHSVKFINTTATDVFEQNGRYFNDQAISPYRADFTTLKAGIYNIELSLIGSGTPFKTISNIELKSRKAYTIYLKGFNGGTGSQALDYAIIQHLL
jgi:Domain of unknown function (DUF4397)